VLEGDELACEENTIDVTFEGYPEDVVIDSTVSSSLSGTVFGSAFGEGFDTVNRNINFANVQRCPSFGVQADGQTSMMASLTQSVFTEDQTYVNNVLLSYGYLLDQDSSLTSYTGQMNQLPTEINFASTSGINTLGVTAFRKGITFFGAGGFSPLSDASPPLTTGSFTTNADFPADKFFVFASYNIGGLSNFERNDFTTLPTTINVERPNYTVGNFVYDEPIRELSWDSDTGNQIDIAQLDIDTGDWSFYLPGERTSIKIPILPMEIQDWATINFDSLAPEADIEYLDIGDCTGYDACLNFIFDVIRTETVVLEEPLKGVNYYGPVEVINVPQ